MTSTTTYDVVGMTCAHCVQAVTDEVSAIPGVRDVGVELVAGGTSVVTVVSAAAAVRQGRPRRDRRGGLRAGRYAMKPAATLTVFAAGLTVVFAVALGLGGAVGPVAADKPAPQHAADADDAHAGDAEADARRGAAHDAAGASPLPGLAVADAGWTAAPRQRHRRPPGRPVPFRFTVIAPDGNPETVYVRTHTKELHLIVVRRDLSSFQHVHPVRAADGSWSVPLDLPAGGSYRVFADFRPAGLDRTAHPRRRPSVPGDVRATGTARREPHTTTGEYDVTLAGTPVAGRESDFVLSVSRDGAPVTALQPYLGAYGHLVALRAGDLAFLHTHPAGHVEPGAAGGPDIAFGTTFPTAGSYRLFLDFQVDDVVRTAAFTVEVGEAP